MHDEIAAERLRRHSLARPRAGRAHDVVRWFGAMQAQEFLPATWGVALRMAGTVTRADVERAIDEGHVLRTHVMRPTWHFVAREDIGWLLKLTAPHVHRRMAPYDRQLGLDANVKTRAAGIVERALAGGTFLTRVELADHLRRAGLHVDGMRMAHLAMFAELEGIICSGPRRGTVSTYALLAERAPARDAFSGDEPLGELARRFLRSHAPATAKDLAWWAGVPMAEARRGIEIVKARPREVDGVVYWTLPERERSARVDRPAHLLPIYDEYLVAYRDRVAVPHRPATRGIAPWFGSFQHSVVVDGQVAGTWRAVTDAARPVAPPPSRARDERVRIEIVPHRRLSAGDRRAIDAAACRYGRFLGAATSVSFPR
jgi:hypothetical protein